jgi:hypothetical protein
VIYLKRYSLYTFGQRGANSSCLLHKRVVLSGSFRGSFQWSAVSSEIWAPLRSRLGQSSQALRGQGRWVSPLRDLCTLQSAPNYFPSQLLKSQQAGCFKQSNVKGRKIPREWTLHDDPVDCIQSAYSRACSQNLTLFFLCFNKFIIIIIGFWWESPKKKRSFERPRPRWEDGIKMDLREIRWGVWSGFTWLRIGTVGGLLWMRWWTFGFWCHGVSC